MISSLLFGNCWKQVNHKPILSRAKPSAQISVHLFTLLSVHFRFKKHFIATLTVSAAIVFGTLGRLWHSLFITERPTRIWTRRPGRSREANAKYFTNRLSSLAWFSVWGDQAKQLPLAQADDDDDDDGDEGDDGALPQGGDYDLPVLVLNVCGHTVNV